VTPAATNAFTCGSYRNSGLLGAIRSSKARSILVLPGVIDGSNLPSLDPLTGHRFSGGGSQAAPNACTRAHDNANIRGLVWPDPAFGLGDNLIHRKDALADARSLLERGVSLVAPRLGAGPLSSPSGPRSKTGLRGGIRATAGLARSRFRLAEATMSHARTMYAQQLPTTGSVGWVFIGVVLFVILPGVLALLVSL
jgi:hypothetical protein